MVQHADLTGAELHEPKGVESAPADSLYFADGAGSGNWFDIFSYMFNFNVGKIYARIDDISTPSSIYLPITQDCSIFNITICIQNAITVANTNIGAYNNSAALMGSVAVLYSGSAIGSLYSITPSVNNTFSANQVLTIATDGASSTACPAWICIDYELI